MTMVVMGMAAQVPDVFAKGNLLAWCIVPFDSAHRGPVERARMLKKLGLTRFVYDWRDNDIPTFDQELDALAAEGIKLQGFWLTSGLHPEAEKNTGIVLGLLKRRKVQTEIWYLFTPPKTFTELSQEEKISQASTAVRSLAVEAEKIGCKVGLYNHGGWFGEPENQLAILAQVRMPNTGMIYNFHHGREQIDRFAQFFPRIMPRLLAVNLNGMQEGAPMILNIGEGTRELEMLRVVRASGYRGPVGLLNHRADRDAEEGLRANMEGLRKLLVQLDDKAALKTY